MHRMTHLRHRCSHPRSSYGRTSHRFGGGHRARRGDTRAAVLALLAERPMHGYEMIKELDERTAGAWVPSPGSVYPTLQLLERRLRRRRALVGETVLPPAVRGGRCGARAAAATARCQSRHRPRRRNGHSRSDESPPRQS